VGIGGQIALSRPEHLALARDWTDEAVKTFPENTRLLGQRAEALLLNHEVAQALPLWRRALAAGVAAATRGPGGCANCSWEIVNIILPRPGTGISQEVVAIGTGTASAWGRAPCSNHIHERMDAIRLALARLCGHPGRRHRQARQGRALSENPPQPRAALEMLRIFFGQTLSRAMAAAAASFPGRFQSRQMYKLDRCRGRCRARTGAGIGLPKPGRVAMHPYGLAVRSRYNRRRPRPHRAAPACKEDCRRTGEGTTSPARSVGAHNPTGRDARPVVSDPRRQGQCHVRDEAREKLGSWK